MLRAFIICCVFLIGSTIVCERAPAEARIGSDRAIGLDPGMNILNDGRDVLNPPLPAHGSTDAIQPDARAACSSLQRTNKLAPTMLGGGDPSATDIPSAGELDLNEAFHPSIHLHQRLFGYPASSNNRRPLGHIEVGVVTLAPDGHALINGSPIDAQSNATGIRDDCRP